MSKPDKAMLTAVIVIAVLAAGVFISKQGFKPFAILPELDNRINYYDKSVDVTQLVDCYNNPSCTNKPNQPNTILENDKFIADKKQSEGHIFFTDNIDVVCEPTGNAGIETKKDFARLKTYVRAKGNGYPLSLSIKTQIQDINLPIPSPHIYYNYEIIPDNLNIGTYDIIINGEFYQRFSDANIIKIIGRCSAGGDLKIDYIKFVPVETYTIKNDEVWVRYQIKNTGSIAYSYTYKDVENQQGLPILGFRSLIEPATIRDLTAQTEVEAPQIYYNLINNKPVPIQPNTVHKIVYRTKFVEGMPLQCKGNIGQAVEKQPDGTWACGGFVKETPIIQQCDLSLKGADCPILEACKSQKSKIKCEPRLVDNKEKNLCIYDDFESACKAQLITYQEIITERENTKFVPIISGSNSFYCFFDKTKGSCQVGEKIISASAPSYVCAMPPDSSTLVSTGRQADECWQSTLNFDGKSYVFKNNEKKDNIGFNIKGDISMGASLDSERKLKDDWGIAGKFTLPDNFLNIQPKSLGNKFILQNSNEQVTFTITNNLGFGIDGGYNLLTTNTALEGGVVLRDETIPLSLKSGINDVTYNFKAEQLGTIVDIIGVFGKIKTDREYIMKSSSNGKEKFLVITKEVKTEMPADIEKVQPKVEIIERIVEKPVIQEKEIIIEKIPAWVGWGLITIILIVIGVLIWKRYQQQ